MLYGKVMIIHLIVGSTKKANYKWVYFLEPKSLGGKMKVEIDLSNYTTTLDFKNATGIDTSSFA